MVAPTIAGPDRTFAAEMELSIVIPARDATATLAGALDALLAQEWVGEWEIVVVDNASTDGTGELVEQYARRDPRVRLVRAPECRGPAAVRNAGVRAAVGDFIAMCDADDIAGEGWVAAMGEALRTNDVVTGPVDVRALNPEWLVATRGVPSSVAPAMFHQVFPIVPSGNCGIRRACWDAVGGFDEKMVTNEDIDLSLRLWLSGYAVHFAPQAVLRYRYRTDARVLYRQGFAYGTYRSIVARRLRDSGRARPPRFAGWRSWILLIAWAPRLATRNGRAAWSWVAGNRLGQLNGSIRNRVLYL
jgi:glycosyltransferase involved in cell wall biosynthesis